MKQNSALAIAERFVKLPLEQRKLFLQKLHDAGKDFSVFPIPQCAPASEAVPLSYAQQRLWFMWQLEPQSAAYNMPVTQRLKGDINHGALQKAFDRLIERHHGLRSTFYFDGEKVTQAIAQSYGVTICEQSATEANISELVSAEIAVPFDLNQGRLLRVKLFALAPQDQVLVVTMHHIVTDGWSMQVMIDEFSQLYQAFCSARDAQLPVLPIQYTDYALWQRQWMEAGEKQRQLDYWLIQLGQQQFGQQQFGKQQPLLEFPTDRPRPAQQSLRGARHAFELPQNLVEGLRCFNQANGATMFQSLLTSLSILLHRYTAQTDIRIGVPTANRHRMETENLIGFFVNTQVIRADVQSHCSTRQLLQQIKATTLAAQSHQDLPFDQLVEALAPERSLSYSPLFQVMYNHQQTLGAKRQELAGLQIETITYETRTAKFDLAIDTFEDGDTIHVDITYAIDLFDATTITRLASSWITCLQHAIDTPQQALGDLPLLDATQYRTLMHDWNDNDEIEYPAGEKFAHRLFEHQVTLRPQAPALIFGNDTLSYAELNTRANRLALKLRERGISADVLVGLALERGVDMVVAMLAVLKAGGAYVPLDPDYPQDRTRYMIEDSGIFLLLTQYKVLERIDIPASLAVICVDGDAGAHPDAACANLDSIVSENNLAYVIYTSGSTGKPKGVAVAHGPFAMHCCAISELYGMTPDDRELQFASINFDGAQERLWVPLVSGAAVMPRDNDMWSVERTCAEIEKHGITITCLTPSYLHQLAETMGKAAAGLPIRSYTVGGEGMPRGSFDLVQNVLQPPRVINGYGPTETVVTPLLWRAHADTKFDIAYMPIGRPVGRRTAYVLDQRLNPVPVGVFGELYIGGEGLARGYHQRAALTAERFVPDPFAAEPGGRLYRTGDLVRYRADGVVEYVGRLDHQVKVRGFRIELGEIETCLKDAAGVEEAVVVVRELRTGRQLVAYAVPIDKELLQADNYAVGTYRETLKAHLKESLPDYMVPAIFVLLETMPLTPAGKLDRNNLPEPVLDLFQQTYVEAVTQTEKTLAAIWQQVLDVERVGLLDNFFELGGDSIIAIQVVSRARAAGYGLAPKQLFQHQTVQALARVASVVDAQRIDQSEARGDLLLTPVQRSFFTTAVPRRDHWNQAVLLKTRERVDVPALQRALQILLRRHDALRLRFFSTKDSDSWRASFIASADHAQVNNSDELLWQCRTSSDVEFAAICEEAQRSLNLASGTLMRAVLIERADRSTVFSNDNGQRLLLVIHHLAVDGVSWRILLDELQTAYSQLQKGKAVVLPPKTHSFKTWGELLQQYTASERLQNEIPCWTQIAQQIARTGSTLPVDFATGANTQRFAQTVSLRLDGAVTRQLLTQANAAYRTRINDLLLSALAQSVCNWSQQDCVSIQLEGHGREALFDGIDISGTVGWFTSVFPLLLTPQATVAANIKAIKEQLRQIPERGIGYGILRYLGDADTREALTMTVPAVTFNYLGQFDRSFDAAAFEPADESTGSVLDGDAPLASLLVINGQVLDSELSLDFGFSTQVFRRETIERLVDEYRLALQALIAHCSDPLYHGVTPADFPLAKLTQRQLDALPFAAGNIEDIYPLSPMQHGMLFHSLYEPRDSAYINQIRVDVSDLDVQKFIAAWQGTVAAHDILRTAFAWQGELTAPVQIVLRAATLPINLRDWRGQVHLQAAIDTLANAQLQQGFDLAQAPLLRIELIRTGTKSHHMIMTNHHILLDGWSTSRLFADVLQRYTGAAVPAVASHYRDYIAWLSQRDAGADEIFWRQQLATLAEPTRLAASVRLDAVALRDNNTVSEHRKLFDPAFTSQLSTFARQQKVTVNTVLQAAWLLLLARYTGQDTVCLGATVSGRPADLPGVEQQLGLFINTLPVIASPQPATTVAAWFGQVQELNVALREYEHTALSDIQRWADLSEAAGNRDLFDTLLVFENYPVANVLAQGEDNGPVFSNLGNQERTNYALTLVAALDDTLTLTFHHELSQFTPAVIRQIESHFCNLLQQMLAAPEQRLASLSILDTQEQHTLLRLWNPHTLLANAGTTASDDLLLHRTIGQWFYLQVQQRPDACALVFDNQQLTYRELNMLSNRIAHRLQAMGIGAGKLVGVAVSRSIDMVAGLLAILKAGAAYVPLDPAYPDDRIAHMIADSGVRLLLTQKKLLSSMSALASNAQIVCIDEWIGDSCIGGVDLRQYSADDLTISTHIDELAYVIYTSGSTGKPKGVAITHANASALINWSQSVYSRDDLNGVLASTSICFDLSVWELFVTFASGGMVVLAQDVRDLGTLPARARVTLINTVPSAIAALLQAGDIPSSVRIVNLAGEPLKQALVDDLYRLAHIEHVCDLYGPSEDTTYSTSTRREAGGRPNIGKPLCGTAAYIVDRLLQPVPLGVSGELCLSGAGIVRGYLNRAALTAEKFIPDPFDANGGRLYRTGDLARFRSDGVIEYIGRIDHQVKVRGFRIELGEIDARLQAHGQVREAVCVAVESTSQHAANKRLIAYVVPNEFCADASVQQDLQRDLLAHLKQQLPDHMVPAQFVFVAALPLTPNGKLDRKKLPSPDQQNSQRTFVAPASLVEQQLAQIWRDVLGLSQVGLRDNFFELGGDSIVSIQVVSRARQLGLRLTPKQVFEHPELQALAAIVSSMDGDCGQSSIEQSAATGVVPLLPAQQWFFNHAIINRDHFNQALLLAMPTMPDVMLLEQALQRLLQQHDALRTTFVAENGQWTATQRAADAALAPLLGVRQCSDADATWEIEQIADAAQRSLNIADGALLRAVAMQCTDGTARLLLVIHHLVVDGVSWRILLDDLQQAYRQLIGGQLQHGEPAQLPPKTHSVKAWAESLRRYAASPAASEEAAFWQSHIGSATASDDLPQDYDVSDYAVHQLHSVNVRLDRIQTRQLLSQVPAAYRTRINDILLTALAQTLCVWSDRASALIELEGHGREIMGDDAAPLDLGRTVGWFTSMYPVRLTPQSTINESLKAIKEQLRAIPCNGAGFGPLRYLAAPVLREQIAQLAQPRVTFNYLGQFDQSFDAEALFSPAQESVGATQHHATAPANWLVINCQVLDGELSMDWQFSSARHDMRTIEKLTDAYRQRLLAIIAHCIDEDAGAITPSDMPLAALSQHQLDSLQLKARDIDDIYPLSPMQQGMFFHSVYDARNSAYINQIRVDVDNLDVARFGAAWQATLDAHDILKACFVANEQIAEPVQIIRRNVILPLAIHDWRDADKQTTLTDELDRLAQREAATGFDLQQAPLLRLVLVRIANEKHHLIVTAHHILMDGWSNAQLWTEVLARYEGVAVAPPRARFRDYIAWIAQQDKAASEQFWKTQLAPLQQPSLLAHAVGTPDVNAPPIYRDQSLQLDANVSETLQQFARDQQVTLNSVVQAAWLLLLSRYSGQHTVCFGATVSGRPVQLPFVEQQLGLFINTLPVVATVPAQATVAQWVRAVQHNNLDLREYEHTALADIQHMARQQQAFVGHDLFDSILIFENYPVSQILSQADAAGGIDALNISGFANSEHTNYPLTITADMHGEGSATLRFNFAWLESHFSAAFITQISSHLQYTLQQFAHQPHAMMASVSILPEQEIAALLRDNNATVEEYPQQESVVALFEAQAEKTPQSIALMYAEAGELQSLNYAGLNARVNQLARLLMARGVGVGSLVGIACQRSLDMVVSLLAVMKAGAAYVPLDPDYPVERLVYMVQGSGLSLVLTQSAVADSLSSATADVDVLCVDTVSALLQPYSTSNLGVRVSPAHLAYVIYTSGSTGKPKGVMVSQQNLVNFLCTMQTLPGITCSDRVLNLTSLSFDIAGLELYLPLISGARVVLTDAGSQRDPAQLLQRIRDAGVTLVQATPSTWRMLVAQADVSALQHCTLLCGGEALPQDLANTLLHTGKALFNVYGPTETTVWSAVHEITTANPQALLGKPIGNTQLYVLDDSLNPVPPGVAGELYIGGDGVARGYYGRAALTAERFVPDPFTENGQRLYRTGDLVRFRYNNSCNNNGSSALEYLGRLDHQVKVRGFRIELSEIENQLLSQPAIKQAVVLAHAGGQGVQLVAYIVTDDCDTPGDTPTIADAAKAALKQQLPEYMVPSLFMVLDQMPLTPNGKLDRKALPVPDVQQKIFIAPQTDLEQQLADIWRQVLKVERVGLLDNYFELGGDSITAIQLVNRAASQRIRIAPKDIFQHQTLQALAAVAQRMDADAATTEDNNAPALAPFALATLEPAQMAQLPLAHIEDIYPLSPMQQGILFHSLNAPELDLYINQLQVGIKGLDVARFKAAWQQAIARHDSLRTGFMWAGALKDPLQIVYRQGSIDIEEFDWRDRSIDADAINTLAHSTRDRGFDLQNAGLMRLQLIRLGDNDYHFIWTYHHVILDGWSIANLMGEVVSRYRAGNEMTLPVAQGRYRDYIAWLQQQDAAQSEIFWKQKLTALEEPTLLGNCINQRNPGTGHHAIYTRLDRAQTQQLQQFAQAQRVTLNTVVQAAWLLLLQAYTGQQTVCFGATVSGRPAALRDAEQILGLFINTLPIVQSPRAEQRLGDWLRALQHYNVEIREQESTPLIDIQRWCGHSGQPLFDSIIVFENQPVHETLKHWSNEGSDLQFDDVDTVDVTNFAMDLMVNVGATLQIEYLYLRDQFDEDTVVQIRAHMETLLAVVQHAGEHPLGSLQLLTQAEHDAIRRANAVGTATSSSHVHRQISANALAAPQRTAMLFGDDKVSYAELEQRANRLAHYLLAAGVTPETVVGVAMPRSPQIVIALLAVLKAGAAYVPLDPDYPAERLHFMMRDSGMQLLLSHSTITVQLALPASIRCIETDTLALDAYDDDAPQVETHRDNLAYLIYTSGSTGVPKGVAVAHGPLAMHCEAIAKTYEMDHRARELHFMSFAFDGAHERWLTTLVSGGSLVIRDNSLWTPEQTYEALHRYKVTIAAFPPAYLQQLATHALLHGNPPAVDIYCFGGDAVANASFELAKKALQPRFIINGYGPTETVVTPLIWKAARDEHCGGAYAPIGRRIGERSLYVLDANLNPVPPGVAGELYIGGEGVARGYHGRATLTAERFVPNPFHDMQGDSSTRLYRSGDLVRLRADGVFDYIGRVDQQVKIRGFRIELGEIEARLQSHPHVEDAIVIARDICNPDEAGETRGKQLLAYVVAKTTTGTGAVDTGTDNRAMALRQYLKQQLPDHMIPAHIMPMMQFPLTPNGKVDRKALPDPQWQSRHFVAPRNALEQRLARIWQDVLQIAQVGVTDNFFELGGDSLHSLKILSAVRGDSTLGFELKLRDLLAKPTIAELSGYNDSAGGTEVLRQATESVAGECM